MSERPVKLYRVTIDSDTVVAAKDRHEAEEYVRRELSDGDVGEDLANGWIDAREIECVEDLPEDWRDDLTVYPFGRDRDVGQKAVAEWLPPKEGE